MVVAVVAMVDVVITGGVVVLFDDDRRGSNMFHDDRRGMDDRRTGDLSNRRILHRGDHVGVNPLLRQRDHVARLKRAGDAIGANVVDDQLGSDSGLRHIEHVAGVHCALGACMFIAAI